MQHGFVETKPDKGEVSKLVLLLHGLGSDAKDLSIIVPYMQLKLPTVHFLALNGVQKYDMAPFGFQWFSRRNTTLEQVQEQLASSGQIVMDFLSDKLASLQLGFEDLFLVGFSQGTMLSLQIATSCKHKLAGIVCFSGTLIPYKQFTGNANTPICFIYGLQDEVLSPKDMEQSAAELTKIGFQVTSHPLANLMHSIDAQGINIANNFILQQL